MSQSTSGTGPVGGEPQGRPFGPVGGPDPRDADPTAPPSEPGAPPTRLTKGGRRPPVWLLTLVGVLVVGLAVVAVLVLNRGDAPEPEVLEPEVVTLTLPTPTIEPVAREAGTALFGALPSTVLGYALTEAGAHPPLVAAGALEAYRMVYSDGGATAITLYAAQWAAPEAATATYQVMVAAQTAEATAAGADAAVVEEGPVQVDGTEVGRSTLVPRADGTGTLTWTNGTVVLEADGPAAALHDFFTAFSL